MFDGHFVRWFLDKVLSLYLIMRPQIWKILYKFANKTSKNCVWTGPVETVGQGGIFLPRFGRSVCYPNPSKGVDNAHHITACPSSGFSDPPSALQYVLKMMLCCVQNILSDGAKIVIKNVVWNDYFFISTNSEKLEKFYSLQWYCCKSRISFSFIIFHEWLDYSLDLNSKDFVKY